MKNTVLISFLLAITVVNIFPQNLPFPNYRIFPGTVTQTEVLSANHPFDDQTLFVTANAITFQPSFFISEGIYVTTNKGASWFGSDTCNGANIYFHKGDPGITINKNGRFILSRLASSPFVGLYSHYSTDQGLNWSTQLTVTNDYLERSVLASDNNPESAFFGRTYGVWVKFIDPFPFMFTYTDNGAESWAPPVPINAPPQRCAGGDIAMGLNGQIFTCWAGVSSSSPFTENYIGFASSANGGTSWQVSESAFMINGIQGILPQKQNIRVNGLPRIAIDTSGGPRNGWLYIITTQKNRLPAGSDPDIILNRSTDNGITWSGGIRVNQDAPNNGKIQYFPAIHVDKYGALNVIYYDDRKTASDSSGVFLSRSVDGGDTWIDYEISDHNFKPTPIGGLGQGYQGDNITITSLGNILFPFWMDNSSGIYQVWTSEIDLTLVSAEDAVNAPESFILYQNYPNPFNPSTTIEFSVAEISPVMFEIYDITGSLIGELDQGVLNPGKYKITLNTEDVNYTSGVYFITLRSNNFRSTVKAVLLK
jgi:hypothetical protein